jgi:hypothetical protein
MPQPTIGADIQNDTGGSRYAALGRACLPPCFSNITVAMQSCASPPVQRCAATRHPPFELLLQVRLCRPSSNTTSLNTDANSLFVYLPSLSNIAKDSTVAYLPSCSKYQQLPIGAEITMRVIIFCTRDHHALRSPCAGNHHASYHSKLEITM